MTVRAWTLSLLALVACVRNADVVARQDEDTALGPNGTPATTPPPVGSGTAGVDEPPPAPCTPSAGLAVATKTLEIHQWDPALKAELPPVKALACEPGPIAIDRAGTIFMVSAGKLVAVDPGTGICKALFALDATAIAFGLDATSRDVLYAVESNVLVTIDVETGAATKVGLLSLPDVRNLASTRSTSSGALYAFGSDASESVVTIALVSSLDASIIGTWTTKNMEAPARFVGGVPGQAGFELVVGSHAYTFHPATGLVDYHFALFAQDYGALAVTTSACAFLGTK